MEEFEKTKAMLWVERVLGEILKHQRNYTTMKRLDEERSRKMKEREDAKSSDSAK